VKAASGLKPGMPKGISMVVCAAETGAPVEKEDVSP